MRVAGWLCGVSLLLAGASGLDAQGVVYVGGGAFAGTVQVPPGSCGGATYSIAGGRTGLVFAMRHLELEGALEIGRQSGTNWCRGGPAPPPGNAPSRHFEVARAENLQLAGMTLGFAPTPRKGLLLRLGTGWQFAIDEPIVTGGLAWRIPWKHGRIVAGADASWLRTSSVEIDFFSYNIPVTGGWTEEWLRLTSFKVGFEYSLGHARVAGERIPMRALADSAALLSGLDAPRPLAVRDTGSWIGWISWPDRAAPASVIGVQSTVSNERAAALEQLLSQVVRREPFGRGAVVGVTLRDSATVRAWEPARLKPVLLNRQQLNDSLEVRAKRLALTGRGAVRVHVDVRGRPDTVRIARTSRHAQLDSMMVEVAGAGRFKPGTIDAHPVPMWIEVPFTARN